MASQAAQSFGISFILCLLQKETTEGETKLSSTSVPELSSGEDKGVCERDLDLESNGDFEPVLYLDLGLDLDLDLDLDLALDHD